MKDLLGRTFARQGEVKPGDIIMVDGTFGGLVSGSEHRVKLSEKKKEFPFTVPLLYINSDDGRFYLDGQLLYGSEISDKNGYYQGIYLQEK